jgi:TatD DNase family protein
MTPLIDICFNFAHESFRKDEAEVMARAVSAGVTHMLVPGSSLHDSAAGIALVHRYFGRLSAAVGVHPHNAREWTAESAPELKALAADPAVRAIGECGLDFNRNFSEPAAQRVCFEAQLELARQLGLPVFLHERDAHADFLAMMKSARPGLAGGVAHCFTGSTEQLSAYLDLDLYIGITGWICDERRGQSLRDAVRSIPFDRLLIETDAPYLIPRTLKPQPKDRRNEPAFLPNIAETIAKLAGRPAEDVAQASSANAKRLFRLDY